MFFVPIIGDWYDILVVGKLIFVRRRTPMAEEDVKKRAAFRLVSRLCFSLQLLPLFAALLLEYGGLQGKERCAIVVQQFC